MIVKRKGERGSPWKIPQEGEKVVEGEPFTRMEKNDDKINDIIHLLQGGEKPKA
jgi:hypothetical protein